MLLGGANQRTFKCSSVQIINLQHSNSNSSEFIPMPPSFMVQVAPILEDICGGSGGGDAAMMMVVMTTMMMVVVAMMIMTMMVGGW